MILHVLSSDNDSGSQAEAESQRAGVHGGRRQDVAQGGKHPEAATGEKYIIEVRLILISLGFFYFCLSYINNEVLHEIQGVTHFKDKGSNRFVLLPSKKGGGGDQCTFPKGGVL